MRVNQKDLHQTSTRRKANLLFHKKRLAAALCLAFGLGSTPGTHALGISEISLESSLNSPLEGLLVVQLDPGEVVHEGELAITLASSSEHKAIGIPYPSMLRGLEIIESDQRGRNIHFRLFSQKPVNEPIISLLLQLEWDSGKLKKEVTLLLDPVDYSPVRAISPENENLLKAGDYIGNGPAPLATDANSASPIFIRAEEPQSVESSPEQATAPSNNRPRHRITIDNGEYGPVRAGDTLSRIAVVAARDIGVDTDTMMELIYDANPEAFSGSRDLLIKGTTLQIPGLMPNLPDVQTMPTVFPEPEEDVYKPPAPVNKPLLTIVGSEDEAARAMPSENQPISGNLTQAGQGTSRSVTTPEHGNANLSAALTKIQQLELANQTLANDKLSLENNLASTQEQLGNVRNDLDRLVVELKALSRLQALPPEREMSLGQQIERWLPWLLLFITLPVALFLGLRSRPRETPVYVPVAAEQPPRQAATVATPEQPEPEPRFVSRENPASASTFDDTQAEDYLPEYDESQADETIANDELISSHPGDPAEFSGEKTDDLVDTHTEQHDPLAETMPGTGMVRPLTDWDSNIADDFEDDDEVVDEPIASRPSQPEPEPEERRLQSLPSEGDTQEVIRSTLHKLESTQLISPGQAPMEPETALDAVQEAEIYIAYDQFSLAEKTIDKLLAQDPDNDRYLLLQLKLFSEMGSMDELQDLSVRLLHKHPNPEDETNQKIRSICDKAFTQTNLKRVDFSQHMAGKLAAENPDNETILDDMTAETLFVDGVKDFLDDDTLLEEDELRAGITLNDTLDDFSGDFNNTLEGFNDDSLGSLTTELPPHVLEERDRTEIFDETVHALPSEAEEETLSEGLELPFDLESEIARYETELEDDLDKKSQS